MKELIIKGHKFILEEHSIGAKYSIKAYHDKFKDYCVLGKANTVKRCKEFAVEFIDKGLWEGWMV